MSAVPQATATRKLAAEVLPRVITWYITPNRFDHLCEMCSKSPAIVAIKYDATTIRDTCNDCKPADVQDDFRDSMTR